MTLEEAVEQLAANFTDGLEFSDLWDAIPLIMSLVESFEGLSGEEKKERALKILDKFLDEFDLPGPDWITKRIIMWLVPGAIDQLVEASKGKFDF